MYPEYNFIGKENICKSVDIAFPSQHQNVQPGLEYLMDPKPIFDNPNYVASGKLKGKVAIITGGDSGIGKAISVLFAKEGASVVIVYLNEDKDANDTYNYIKSFNGNVSLIRCDLTNSNNAKKAVDEVIRKYGKIDILVNNIAVQFIKDSILDISDEQLLLTYQTNVFSYFYMIRNVLPHLKEGDSIINTASITAYNGEKKLIDYSSTKGAIVSLTRSLSLSLAEKKIRVNAVAPGPIWTPLIPASYSEDEVKTFGTYTSKVPMNRAGEPFEVAPAYLYLASDDSRYVSGQVIHVNGGAITES